MDGLQASKLTGARYAMMLWSVNWPDSNTVSVLDAIGFRGKFSPPRYDLMAVQGRENASALGVGAQHVILFGRIIRPDSNTVSVW